MNIQTASSRTKQFCPNSVLLHSRNKKNTHRSKNSNNITIGLVLVTASIPHSHMIKTVSLLSFLNSLISTLSALCNLYLQTTPPSVDLAFEAIPNLMSSCCVCSRILYFAVCVRVSCILHVLLSLMGTVVVPTKSCFNQWEFFPLGNLD